MAVTIDGVGEINGVVLPTTGFGKVLQVVRATDTTDRATTSLTFVDVPGMSVTITPQKSTSAILLITTARFDSAGTGGAAALAYAQITDASNNGISGASISALGSFVANTTNYAALTLIGYSTPGTTSATTYKTRFRGNNTGVTATFSNSVMTGQMYAIEVSA